MLSEFSSFNRLAFSRFELLSLLSNGILLLVLDLNPVSMTCCVSLAPRFLSFCLYLLALGPPWTFVLCKVDLEGFDRGYLSSMFGFSTT